MQVAHRESLKDVGIFLMCALIEKLVGMYVPFQVPQRHPLELYHRSVLRSA